MVLKLLQTAKILCFFMIISACGFVLKTEKACNDGESDTREQGTGLTDGEERSTENNKSATDEHPPSDESQQDSDLYDDSEEPHEANEKAAPRKGRPVPTPPVPTPPVPTPPVPTPPVPTPPVPTPPVPTPPVPSPHGEGYLIRPFSLKNFHEDTKSQREKIISIITQCESNEFYGVDEAVGERLGNKLKFVLHIVFTWDTFQNYVKTQSEESDENQIKPVDSLFTEDNGETIEKSTKARHWCALQQVQKDDFPDEWLRSAIKKYFFKKLSDEKLFRYGDSAESTHIAAYTACENEISHHFNKIIDTYFKDLCVRN